MEQPSHNISSDELALPAAQHVSEAEPNNNKFKTNDLLKKIVIKDVSTEEVSSTEVQPTESNTNTNTINQPKLDDTWTQHLSSDFTMISPSLAANSNCLMLQMKSGGGVQCIPYANIRKLYVDEKGVLHGQCGSEFNNKGWVFFNLDFTNTKHANIALAKLVSFVHRQKE